MWTSVIFLLATSLCSVHGEGVRFKQWLHSTNYGEASNWDAGRIPCSKDRIRLPDNSPTIYIQTNTTVTEMILPLNGELVLGSFMSISAALPAAAQQAGGSQDDCQGTDIEFTRTEAKSWFDPASWCVTGDHEASCKASQPDLLESEQIPCRYDGITFPERKSFLVNLATGVDITMRALRLAGRTFSTGSFKQFLKTREGLKQFKRSEGPHDTTVSIPGKDCDDKSGCACGNDKGAIFEQICAAMNDSCNSVGCVRPIRAVGSCCDVCGSFLEIDYDHDTFRIERLRGTINSKFDVSTKPKVQSVVSKTGYDQIQVLLYDNGDGSRAISVGKQLKDKLDADMDRYGVTYVSLKSSSNTPEAQKDNPKKTGTIAGIAIAIIVTICVLLLLCYFFAYRRAALPRLNESFRQSFRKFGGKKNNDNLELHSKEPRISFTDLARGFDNPMYGDLPVDANANSDMQPVKMMKDGLPGVMEVSSSEAGFSNPLYGNRQNSIESSDGVNVHSRSAGITNPMYGTGVPMDDNTTMDIHERPAGISNPLYGSAPIESSPTSIDITDIHERAAGISNPLYGTGPIEEIVHQNGVSEGIGNGGSSYFRFNPAYSTEGVEEDTGC